jgi:hypothetical protein
VPAISHRFLQLHILSIPSALPLSPLLRYIFYLLFSITYSLHVPFFPLRFISNPYFIFILHRHQFFSFFTSHLLRLFQLQPHISPNMISNSYPLFCSIFNFASCHLPLHLSSTLSSLHHHFNSFSISSISSPLFRLHVNSFSIVTTYPPLFQFILTPSSSTSSCINFTSSSQIHLMLNINSLVYVQFCIISFVSSPLHLYFISFSIISIFFHLSAPSSPLHLYFISFSIISIFFYLSAPSCPRYL